MSGLGQRLLLRRAALRSAVLFGVGGSSWTAVRTTGDGITAATSTTSRTVTAFVVPAAAEQQATAAPGVVLPLVRYELIAVTGTDVLPGDVVTSVADTTLSFRVQPFTPVGGYIRAPLERER